MERALAEYLTHAPVFIRTFGGEIVYWTSGAQELYGYTPSQARGKLSHDLLKTVFPEPLAEIESKLRDHGEWTGRLQHTARDGRTIWTESHWRLRPGERPEDAMVVEMNTDITARVEVEHQREILARELDHRVKNTLAVVQGLARLSFGAAEAQHVKRFEGRLIALSEAHNLLLQQNWDHANLWRVIESVTASLGVAERVQVEGPDVQLRPSAAVAYALAFHELCTNAIKHGSLSVGSGHVEIVWSLEGAGGKKIHLVWRELGGPPVKRPEHNGFGSKLIQRTLSQELGTPIELRFEPTGLVCEFDGPLQKAPKLPKPSGDVI